MDCLFPEVLRKTMAEDIILPRISSIMYRYIVKTFKNIQYCECIESPVKQTIGELYIFCVCKVTYIKPDVVYLLTHAGQVNFLRGSDGRIRSLGSGGEEIQIYCRNFQKWLVRR